MIAKCNINGCPTRWLRLPFGYLRLNPFRRKTCMQGTTVRGGFWISKKWWEVTR